MNPSRFHQQIRAAAVVIAAVVTSAFSQTASAQIADIFGGTIGNPASLGISTTVALGNQSTSGSFGPTGWNGTLSLSGNGVDTLSEGFVSTTPTNTLYISQTGIAVLGGQVTATKSFGAVLSPATTYSFNLTRTSGYTVGLLGSLSISVSSGGTTFLNTSTGQGLAGSVDVLGLFGTSNAENFTFVTPPTLNPALPIAITFTGNLPVAALGGSYDFTGASITAVPEPGIGGTAAAGFAALAISLIRRNPKSVTLKRNAI